MDLVADEEDLGDDAQEAEKKLDQRNYWTDVKENEDIAPVIANEDVVEAPNGRIVRDPVEPTRHP